MAYKNNIGNKIRRIREHRNLSQGELGDKVGLSANRIQKYENSYRTPKKDMLDKIAKALQVNPASLLDNEPTTDMGAMYSLFELEEHYKLEIRVDYNGMCIYFDKKSPLIPHLEEWRDKKIENINDKQSYNDWKWNYTGEIANKRQKREEIGKAIAKLEEELERLEQGE